MAKKTVEKKSHAEETWEKDDVKYPRKRDICNTCKQRDEVKLSYDRHNYICVNMHACMLRFSKLYGKK